MFNLIRLLLFILILVLPLGHFSRLPAALGEIVEVRIYLNDLLLPIIIFLWVIWRLGLRKNLRLPPLSGLIFLWIGIAVISLLNGLRFVGLKEFLVGALYLVRWVEYVFLYWVVLDLTEAGGRKFIMQAFNLLILAVSLFAGVGLLQFLFFPDFSRLVEHGWDPHYYRVLSSFFDPNFAGIFLVLGLLLILSLLFTLPESWSLLSVFKIGLPILLILPTILLTFSRSSYLSFLVGMGIFGWLRSKRLLALIIILGLLAVGFIPRVRLRIEGAFNLDVTARIRIENWQRAVAIVRENWLLGVGFNTYRYAQERYGFFRDKRGVEQSSGHAGAGSDSSFLFVWATTGIFGFLVYLVILTKIWILAWRRRFQVLGLTLVAALPALIVHSQFVNSLFYPWIMEWMWIVTGLLIGSRQTQDASEFYSNV